MLDTLNEKFSDAFRSLRGKSKISEDNIEETLKVVRTALLEADVNFKVVKEFIEKVKVDALGEKFSKAFSLVSSSSRSCTISSRPSWATPIKS